MVQKSNPFRLEVSYRMFIDEDAFSPCKTDVKWIIYRFVR